MVYPIARHTLLPFIRFFIKKAVGLENIPMKGPYILACKHLGPLDGPFIGAVIIPKIDQKIYFFANYAKWGWFWEKVVCERWAGNIPFFEDNPKLCIDMALDHLQKGHIVGIFPEGVVQDYDPRQRRAKTGTARLAIWAKVPIIPVGLVHDISIRHDLPKIQRRRQVIKNFLLNPHSLEIHIGRPFQLQEYYDKPIEKESLVEATNKIMDKIDSLTNINNTNGQ